MNRRFHPILGPPISCNDPRAYAVSGNKFTDEQGRQIHDGNEANESGGTHGDKPVLKDTNVFESLVEWDEFYGPPVRKRKVNANVEEEWKRDADAIKAGRNVNLGAPPQNFAANQQQSIMPIQAANNNLAGAPYGHPQIAAKQQQPPLPHQHQVTQNGTAFAGAPTTLPQQGPPTTNTAPRLAQTGMTAPPQATGQSSSSNGLGGLLGGLAADGGTSPSHQPATNQAQAYVPHSQQAAAPSGGNDLGARIAEGRAHMQGRIERMETRHRERMHGPSKDGSPSVREEGGQNEAPLAPSPLEDLARIFEEVLGLSGTPVVADAQREGIRQMPPDVLKTRIMSVYLQHIDLTTLPPNAQRYFMDLRAEIRAIGLLPPDKQQEYIAAAPPPMREAIMETRDIHKAIEGGGSPSNICNQAMQRQILERLRTNGGLVPLTSGDHPHQPFPTPDTSRQASAFVEGGGDSAAVSGNEGMTSKTPPTAVNPMTPNGSPERKLQNEDGHTALQFELTPPTSQYSVASNNNNLHGSGDFSNKSTSHQHPNIVPIDK